MRTLGREGDQRRLWFELPKRRPENFIRQTTAWPNAHDVLLDLVRLDLVKVDASAFFKLTIEWN
jgi:hypothetical protein